MNSLFLTPGRDPYAHLKPHFISVPRAAFEGVWATLEIQPDLFARQRFAVGVAVADLQGSFSFKILEDLVKFECFYGRDDVASIRSLLELAEQTLLRAQQAQCSMKDVEFDSPAIFLGDLWPTSGDSVDAVLSRLYLDVIPFLPNDEKRIREFVTLDNTAVRRLVEFELKRISGLEYERFATAPQRQVRDSATGESHWSADMGKTWNTLVADGKAISTYYYPKAIQMADGKILCVGHFGSDDVYGTVDQSIRLQTFRLAIRNAPVQP